ncbi:MAG: hypothetical protein ACI9G1_004476 [Pirellulaceae bacterium]
MTAITQEVQPEGENSFKSRSARRRYKDEAMMKNCPLCSHELLGEFEICLGCGHEIGPLNTSVLGIAPAEPQPIDAAGSLTSPGEDTLWVGTYSGKAMLGSWLLAAGFTVAGAAIGAFTYGMAGCLIGILGGGAIILGWVSLVYVYRTGSVNYTLTGHRFTHRHGFFSHVTSHIEVIDVDDITMEQSIVQRLVGVGSLKLHSSDQSHPVLWLHGIDKVGEVAEVLERARRRERHKRALHVTAI